MKLKQFIPSFARGAESGFTVSEMLVASTLGLLVLSITLSTSVSLKRLFKKDLVRTRVNQQLRGSFDTIGATMREMGENLPGSFPALEIIDGTSGAPDELRIRRGLDDSTLKVCTKLTRNNSDTEIEFAKNTTTAGCSYADNTTNYNIWNTERLAMGGSFRAYVYNFKQKAGQWIDYQSETDTGVEYKIDFPSTTWERNYTKNNGSVYMLEEWRLYIQGDVLQLELDGDTSIPLSIMYDISDFQVTAKMQDGTTQSSFESSDTWVDLASVEIMLESTGSANGETLTRSMTVEYFPRNILSN